jgi:hypothetical protein
MLNNVKFGKMFMFASVLLVATIALTSCAKKQPAGGEDEPEAQAATTTENAIEEVTPAVGAMVALPLEIPDPQLAGTPPNLKGIENLEKYDPDAVRPAFMAPAGAINLADGKSVTSTDDEPIMGDLEMITDGDKDASDSSVVELGPFEQSVTVDLEQMCEIYAIVVWHYHREQRVYFDVIAQVAEDADFMTSVTEVFNNDIDNSYGLGIGKDMHYVETNEGRLMDAKGVKGQFIRLHSSSSNTSDLNNYIEIEVWGKPISE